MCWCQGSVGISKSSVVPLPQGASLRWTRGVELRVLEFLALHKHPGHFANYDPKYGAAAVI